MTLLTLRILSDDDIEHVIYLSTASYSIITSHSKLTQSICLKKLSGQLQCKLKPINCILETMMIKDNPSTY